MACPEPPSGPLKEVPQMQAGLGPGRVQGWGGGDASLDGCWEGGAEEESQQREAHFGPLEPPCLPPTVSVRILRPRQKQTPIDPGPSKEGLEP
eukprot:2158418-Pyramimonas_sp.AAC.1